MGRLPQGAPLSSSSRPRRTLLPRPRATPLHPSSSFFRRRLPQLYPEGEAEKLPPRRVAASLLSALDGLGRLGKSLDPPPESLGPESLGPGPARRWGAPLSLHHSLPPESLAESLAESVEESVGVAGAPWLRSLSLGLVPGHRGGHHVQPLWGIPPKYSPPAGRPPSHPSVWKYYRTAPSRFRSPRLLSIRDSGE